MNTVLLLLFFTAMMRMILLSFNHYHVYEKIMNFRMVLIGAKARPYYWFVIALDITSAILFSFVIFAALRYRYVVPDQVRFYNFLPFYLLTMVLFIVFAACFNQIFARNQAWNHKIFRVVLVVLTGTLFVLSLVYSAAVLQMGNFRQGLELLSLLNGRAWILPAIFWTGLLGIVFCLSPFLRAIPLIGDYLFVLLHEGMVLLAFERASTFLLRPISYQPPTLLEVCLCNLRPFYLGLSILAVFLFLLITMYSDEKEKENRKMPPAFIVDEKSPPHPILTSNSDTAVLQGQKLTITVHKEPFEIEIKQADQRFLQFNAYSFSTRLMFNRKLSIPSFIPENRIPFFWYAKNKKESTVRQLRVLENRVQIVFEGGNQMMISLYQEDVLQIKMKNKARKNREFQALVFEFSRAASDQLMSLSALVKETNQSDLPAGRIIEIGQVVFPNLKQRLSSLFSVEKDSQAELQLDKLSVPFLALSRETGEVFGLFNDTYSPGWVDTIESSSVKIIQASDQMNIYLCCGPSIEKVEQQFSQLTALSQLLTRSAQCHENSETIKKKVSDCLPYLNSTTALFRLAAKNGYLVKNQLGLPYVQNIVCGNAGLIDFTNSEACQWYSEFVWKHPESQSSESEIQCYFVPIPEDAEFQNGFCAAEMQNAYPLMALECEQITETSQ